MHLPYDDAEWRAFLLDTHPQVRWWRRFRKLFRVMPSAPRCKVCLSPFAGPFRPLMRLLGKEPFAKNPHYCQACYGFLTRSHGGAEVELSMLFADVRGSTPLGDRLGPRGLRDLMDRFYARGVDILARNDALIERFMGDQVVGYFLPGFAGERHARRAIDAALEILAATGNVPGTEPWVPVGVGVHTGVAFVGTVGDPSGALEFTAIGDAVNIAARLASAASAGELIASDHALAMAGVSEEGEPRELELKGVARPVSVRALRATVSPAPARAS